MEQSLEVYDPDDRPDHIARWRPSDVTGCVSTLQQLDRLSRLPKAELATLAPLCVLRGFEAGEQITTERDIARMLYIVLQGTVSLSQIDPGGQDVLLAMLGRGDIFGEGGLFGLRYRRVTGCAETRVILLQIANSELLPKLSSLPVFRVQLHRAYRDRLLQTTLARVPLFSALTPIERMALTAELEEQQIERGEHVQITRNEAPAGSPTLSIIAEGQAIVGRNGRQIAVLNPGDFFGEMELLHIDTPVADISALTPLHILTLSASTFTQLLEEHPAIAAGMRELAQQRLREGHTEQHISMTEAAIEAGVVRGRKVLARIPALCPPGCNLCEQACAGRHGATRIHLDGTNIGNYDIPTGCMHCTWSPECSDACPENAIQLGDNGLLFVNDHCTGCGACAEACPYDAITMIPLYPPITNTLDWMLRRVHQPKPIRMHANKCDGCHGYSDQACLSICPTGSLRWIDDETLYAQEVSQNLHRIGETEP
jgi:CRP-like cAMP-binding protein/Fe-S-cluster-containing dehydrogenase component